MENFINYYDVLEISQDATKEEIDKKCKQCSKEWGLQQNSPDIDIRRNAEDNLSQLPKIKDTLLDESKRQDYNKKLKEKEEYERNRQQSSNNDTDIITGNELILRGSELLNRRKLKEALAIATQASEKFGDNPDSWYLLAKVKFANGDTEDAIYEFKRAISKRDNFALYHFELGQVYRSINKNIEALSELERAVNYDPNTLSYELALMQTYYDLERYEKAVRILEKLEKYGNNNPSNDEISSLLKTLKQRSFGGSHQLGIGAGLLWGLVSMVIFSPQGIGFLLIPLYYLAARPRQYQVYKRMAGNLPNLHTTWQQAQGLGKFLALLVFPFFILSDFIDNYLLDRVGASFPNPIRTIINLILRINFQIIILVIVFGVILSILAKTIVNYLYPDPVSTRLSKIDEDFKKCLRQLAGQKITIGLSCYQKTSQQLDVELINIEQQILNKLNNQKEKDNFILQQKSWKQSMSKNLDIIEGRISKRSDKELILKNQQVEMTQKRIEFIRDRANKQNFSIK